MPCQKKAFVEIEHKFLVGADFDLLGFAAALRALCPRHESRHTVRERYYGRPGGSELLLRHSFDAERQRLTVKTKGLGDSEVRKEANLALDLVAGDQRDEVAAFLGLLGIAPLGELEKRLLVFEFSDCEVVYYEAETEKRRVRCVEFEALEAHETEAARAVLIRYETATGFMSARRETRPLFELLFGD
jgi:hypothetical protein